MGLNEYLFKELDSIRQLIWNFVTKIKDFLVSEMSGSNRDDFTSKTKKGLGMRVNYICSNPTCRRYTLKPKVNDLDKWDTLGDAAHIKGARPGAKRHDPNMTSKQRKSIENGIWLCKRCHVIVDSEPDWTTVELLQSWKTDAELRAVNNSAEDNIKQSAIDDLTIAIRSLDNFLDQSMLDESTHDLWNRQVKREITWDEYNNLTTKIYNETKREYEKSILPEIQAALVKCRSILGESNKMIINAFENLGSSSCNILSMKNMISILYELKETILWR
ncbi:hypothetical protein RG963_10705 [Methanosarcina sp. Z-7115]|uniref:HNH endonuclease n=1 Tax=Methanosarcina baikalica TaxID=3073890 RepID=A0ABU2D313_9EURY|nr:hypothetical protein [Methanosarcina sp. Z-7115]MDR7666237.1 hypothetical protein [Methanosarcina sp. Z-7115]